MKSQIYSKLIITSILLVFACSLGMAQSATLTIHQDPKITELLSLKKDLEKENKLTDGYTIQLYYGEMDKASQILIKYRGSYGQWPASIEYETPNYKVWAGNFSTRIEAERALLDIQKNFSSAFILKPDRRK
ncbi:SPOR domain-containing protein [Aequorivita sp. H23M31]|uniref:SPOR domain-containing protein n=1 Tax=Aequorivita ciconiae TaxID=2494375 RepID=A0A410G417_9FLAO|nr:SPOR domain-containing protein [Aequorivita sp. H23M31]QAA81989.1 SPOR domain-containing protein [Aequorivita sp. H23M31]